MECIIRDGEDSIVLSTENLNNDSFIEILLDNDSIVVPIIELKSAVDSFYKLMKLNMKRDEYLRE